MSSSFRVEAWGNDQGPLAYNVVETREGSNYPRVIAAVTVGDDPRMALLEAYAIQYAAMGPVPSIMAGFEHDRSM